MTNQSTAGTGDASKGWEGDVLDPCMNLDCRAMNRRRSSDPRPELCPRCGAPLAYGWKTRGLGKESE
jgi:hypothetical protein